LGASEKRSIKVSARQRQTMANRQQQSIGGFEPLRR
jgi:hypothetical protein